MSAEASLTQLAKHLPSAGGYCTYVSRRVGPPAGFMLAWLASGEPPGDAQ